MQKIPFILYFYQRFLKKNMDLFLFMSIMLAICLSKMFSQDKEERMNEVQQRIGVLIIL